MSIKAIYFSTSVLSAALALSLGNGWVNRAGAEALQPEVQASGLGQTRPIESPDLELFSNLQEANVAAIGGGTVSFDTNSASLLAAVSNASDATSGTETSIPVATSAPTTIARLDLELLCQHFPLNSRCQGTPADNGQPAQPDAAPASTESTPDAATTTEDPTPKHKKVGFAIAPSLSTTGLGVEVTKSVVPHLNARINANFFDFKFNNEISKIDYSAKVKLLNVSFIGDMYPWKKSGFHLSVGGVLHNNKLDGDGKPQGSTFKIDGHEYTIDQVGTVKAKVTYPGHVSPYVGLGWGNPVAFNRNLSININAGVIFTGAPHVDFDAQINSTLPEQIQQQIRRDIAKERRQLQHTLDGYSIYPVVSLSFSYQF